MILICALMQQGNTKNAYNFCIDQLFVIPAALCTPDNQPTIIHTSQAAQSGQTVQQFPASGGTMVNLSR